MFLNLPEAWQFVLESEKQQENFTQLDEFVSQAYSNSKCFPPKEYIFSAFDYCKPEDVKVVILGQDPYHGFGQANGLAFSVYDGVRFPPSLINIFKEIEADLDLPLPISGNLERWAEQGVLLLNATLTVEESKAGSHQKKGWEIFTDEVIKKLSENYNTIVFMLWGSFARNKVKLIDAEKHLILESGHPSPLSANRGHWFENKHFSKGNKYLKKNKRKPIEW
nr:uracil-DNA glycosylase [uncultured Flavobacterium sp.]